MYGDIIRYGLELCYIVSAFCFTIPHADTFTMLMWSCTPIMMFVLADRYLPTGSSRDVRIMYVFAFYLFTRWQWHLAKKEHKDMWQV